MKTKHVVKWSRGITSAVVGSLVVQEQGRENTLFVSHNTQVEHPDTYRFGVECAAYLGMPIVDVSDGRSPAQVFRDEKFLGNNRLTMCSRVLKQEQGDEFITGLVCIGFDVVVYVGFTADEMRRVPEQREAYRKLGADVRFPLIEAGLDKDDCKRIVTDCWGITLPWSYLHFDHSNCLGDGGGCVKGGLEYMGLLYLYQRPAWENLAALEDEFKQTILKYTRYGKYPDGSLRNMLPRCIAKAKKYEQEKRQGNLIPLMNAPCVCAA